MGAEAPRDLPVEGRELEGVHFAMEFLPQQNKRSAGDAKLDPAGGSATSSRPTSKHVIVIGGGDTGSDCVGTSHRHKAARSVTSVELLPNVRRTIAHPSETHGRDWPRMSFMQLELPRRGRNDREYAEMTKRTRRTGTVRVEGAARGEGSSSVRDERGRPVFPTQREEVPGSEFEKLPADLVLLAMGFVHPEHAGLIESLGLDLDSRGNVLADANRFETSEPGVFAAGDVRRGQSLVVWAQWEGREAARAVDAYLSGSSRLQSRNAFV